MTPKSSKGNIERYLLRCRSFLIRWNSVLSGFSFSLFVNIHKRTETQAHFCKPFSDAGKDLHGYLQVEFTFPLLVSQAKHD